MLNITVIVLLFLGLFFFFAGSVGILRFPDFYSRLHPAGKIDSMGLLLTMSAMALYTVGQWNLGAFLTAIKIMLIVVFIYITSPTATHAIVDAGVRAGLTPWIRSDKGTEHDLAA
jgi:multicomponent Na+:H+ antiporter subunit G